MKFSPKELLKYFIVLIVTGGIIWYLLNQIELTSFKSALSEFNFWWIGLSILLSVLSHFIRAWRWKLMLESTGHSANLTNGYFAVMIGYLANSIFPRLGEVTRCGIIHKTDNVPISTSLGTVVTERVIDLLMLLMVTALTFLLQFNLLRDFFFDGLYSFQEKLINSWWILTILAISGIVGIYLLFYTKLGKKIKLILKLQQFIKGLWEGIIGLKNLQSQSKFWGATLSIWMLYFLMLYVITFGSPLTENIGILAGLSILVMGSFGMASPIPNGIGVFHTLVAGILVLYGIKHEDGIIFATIMHTSQFLTVLVIGSLSLILVNLRRKKQDTIEKRKED